MLPIRIGANRPWYFSVGSVFLSSWDSSGAPSDFFGDEPRTTPRFFSIKVLRRL